MKKVVKVCLCASCFSLFGLNNVKKADALVQTWSMTQRGEKAYSNSTVSCSFEGLVKADGRGFFRNDAGYWTGIAKAAWDGANPYNAETITLVNTFWLDGIGSFSIGTSGVDVSTSGNTGSCTYTIKDDWRIEVHYSYSAEIYSIFYQGQKVSAHFKFGNTFVDVDSEADNVYENRVTISFS